MAGAAKPTPQQVASSIYEDVTRKTNPYHCRDQAIARARKTCDGKHSRHSSSYASCMRYYMKRKTLELCWKGFIDERISKNAKALCSGAAGPCTASMEQTLSDLIDPAGFMHTTRRQKTLEEKAAKEAEEKALREAQAAAERDARAAQEAEANLPLPVVTPTAREDGFQVRSWHVAVATAGLVGAWYMWGRRK